MEVIKKDPDSTEVQPDLAEANERNSKTVIFPIPCFRKDLLRLSAGGQLRRAILMLDGSPDESAQWVDFWTTFLPQTKFTIVMSRTSSESDSEACEIAVERSDAKIIELKNWVAGHGVRRRPLARIMRLAGPQDAILTCRPYDSNGRLVKSLEHSMIPAMRAWGCTFLAHSLHDECVRPLSTTIIFDRVWFRPLRLIVYRFIVYFLYTCACFLPRPKSRSWQRIVLDRDE